MAATLIPFNFVIRKKIKTKTAKANIPLIQGKEKTAVGVKARQIENAFVDSLSKLVATMRSDTAANSDISVLQRKYGLLANEVIKAAIQQVYILGSEYVARKFNVNSFLTGFDLQKISDLTLEFYNSFWIRVNAYMSSRQDVLLTTKQNKNTQPTMTTYSPRSPLSDSYIVTRVAVAAVTRTLSLSTVWKVQQIQQRPHQTDSITSIATAARMIRTAATNDSATVVWETANDDLVCPICEALEGQEFDVNDPTMPIPPDDTHDNCRCELVISDTGGDGEDPSLSDLLLPSLSLGAAAGAVALGTSALGEQQQQCDNGYHWDEDLGECVADDDTTTTTTTNTTDTTTPNNL